MIINNKSSKINRKDDSKIISTIVMVFLFVVWLCTPPGNKFAQLCFYGHKTQFFIAKLTKPKEELNEWLFHRNNAIYLALMENKKLCLREIDKAIMIFPSYKTNAELNNLYYDRAQLRLYFKEYEGALEDFLRTKEHGFIDKFKIALLLMQKGSNKMALSYCNDIINIDATAYSGYVCLAEVYAGVGKYKTSVKAFDLLIDRVPNRARYYADRAYYKKMSGDLDGYTKDLATAKNLDPNISENSSLIENTLNTRKISLTIQK